MLEFMYSLRQRSIRVKIILIILAVILFFGSIATITTYLITKHNTTTQVTTDLKDKINGLSQEIFIILRQSERVVSSVAKHEEVIAFLTDPKEKDVDVMRKHLQNLNIDNIYDSIYLIDKTGQTLVSTDKSFEKQNYKVRPYFQQAMNGKQYFDVSIGITSGKLGFYFSSPVYSDGKIIGVVVLKLNPSDIDSIIQRTYATSYHIMLVDQYGVVILSNLDDLLYRPIDELSEKEKETIKTTRRYQDKLREVLKYGKVREAIEKTKTPTIFQAYDPYEQEQVYYATTHINKGGLSLIFEMDADVINKPATNIGLTIGGFVLLAALLAVIAISILMIRIIKPIEEISRIANNIAEGNFDNNIDTTKSDEIGILSKSILLMQSKLKQKYEALNTDVENQKKELEEKIAQLHKLNTFMIDREMKMVELKKQLKNGTDTHEQS